MGIVTGTMVTGAIGGLAGLGGLLAATSLWHQQASDIYNNIGDSNTTNHSREYDVFLHAYVSARLAQTTNADISMLFGCGR